MVSPELARALATEVGERATPSDRVGPPGGGTAQVSAVDAEGNAVSLTTTVNGYYGACLVVPGTGILLNDEMDDFDTAPGIPNQFGLVGTGANAVAPGKVPLSSMCPSLVFAPDGRLLMAIGSSGGSTIPSTVAQAIANVVDHKMRLDDALAAPKIHHQWLPDRIVAEPWALDVATERALRARGHEIETLSRPFGNAQAVMIDPATGWRLGASDPKWDGRAAAP